MTAKRLIASVVLAGFGWAAAGGHALAQGNSQGRGNSQGQKGSDDKQGKDKQGKEKELEKGKAAPRAEIGQQDRDAISKYFKTNTAALPPGLAKRGGDLPPGLEKQLQKNGKLPPGLEKKLEAVPAPLEKQLGPLPEGYSRRIIGNHLLVVNEKTKAIGDVFLNVVR
jgi:hypothetical protein